jgi:hypothetical protein
MAVLTRLLSSEVRYGDEGTAEMTRAGSRKASVGADDTLYSDIFMGYEIVREDHAPDPPMPADT